MNFFSGDVYAYKLYKGYYVAFKVLKYEPNKRNKLFFVLSSYCDKQIPTIDDERLDTPYEKRESVW
ncbi:hypothetical protein JCM19046_3043 [Bacillus sp. JCM 19046]|nr:hypothetical protein JCM19046_3043 [Bacillus sp. JCM 19046]